MLFFLNFCFLNNTIQIKELIMTNSWLAFKKAKPKDRFSIWLKWCGLMEKSYQIKGFEWCSSCEAGDLNRGGILADEMGLGKTIMMLGHIFCNSKKRTLIVLPYSLLSQWDEYIQKCIFSLKLRWLLKREYCVFHGKNTPTEEELMKKRLVITTYGTLVARQNILKAVPWTRVIYDEAHHLREQKTQTFIAASSLSVKINWFITGTPIQNRKSDFDAFCVLLGFDKRYYRSTIGRREIICLRVLRRTKEEVGLNLPPLKSYTKNVCWTSKSEEALSTQIHAYTNFSGAYINVHQPSMELMTLSALVRSRQMCVYPKSIEAAILAEKTPDFLENGSTLWRKMTASKLHYVAMKIKRRSTNRRRKLVFCYYRTEIDELERQLKQMGVIVAVIDGRTSAYDRQQLLRPLPNKRDWNTWFPFMNTPGCPIYDIVCNFLKPQVLLVQIQTASEGLNLQDFCEIYFTSPHWNPAVEDQAVARCHRFGQTRKVQVFRFIMEPMEGEYITLDEYCSYVQRGKRRIFKEMFINEL